MKAIKALVFTLLLFLVSVAIALLPVLLDGVGFLLVFAIMFLFVFFVFLLKGELT